MTYREQDDTTANAPRKPLRREVLDLCRDNATIATCVKAWQHGFCTFEDAMISAVCGLATQNRSALSQLAKLLQHGHQSGEIALSADQQAIVAALLRLTPDQAGAARRAMLCDGEVFLKLHSGDLAPEIINSSQVLISKERENE
jgi:hypothetical protein